MDPKQKADKLLDEILLFTVLDKAWTFTRVADFTLDKTLEVLEDIHRVTGSIEVANKIDELREMQQHIHALTA